MSAGVVGAATSPVVRTVQMFAAAVQGGVPAIFDPAQQGRFLVSSPPAGWVGLGAVLDVARVGETSFAEVWSGTPATVKTRGRAKVDATVSCTFGSWSKLALLLSSGSQGMNLLRGPGAGADDSGGLAEGALPVLSGSTSTVLVLAAGSRVSVGDAIVVDTDYAGANGAGGQRHRRHVPGEQHGGDRGCGLRAAREPECGAGCGCFHGGGCVDDDGDTGRAAAGGCACAGMKLAVLLGFTDRLGGSYAAEWSALFVMDGVQGDRVLVHYPRLQSAAGATEVQSAVAAGLERWRLRANFRALPVTDPNDGEAVLCFRSYLPAPMRTL